MNNEQLIEQNLIELFESDGEANILLALQLQKGIKSKHIKDKLSFYDNICTAFGCDFDYNYDFFDKNTQKYIKVKNENMAEVILNKRNFLNTNELSVETEWEHIPKEIIHLKNLECIKNWSRKSRGRLKILPSEIFSLPKLSEISLFRPLYMTIL